ncbi:hypothetical protein BN14_06365 [Rhizoctonia solani AG-1 IB]|uniref:Uncharacterized protein n=2 Tax=Rhizoctonia solani TaxID=456999 RepID=A0A8H3BDM7_9AGAM|nr:unnamed protein product [Rhizoctonia solani]CCO32308.1 hypothetical protein BN14_06365 [Rhizoctonia solani AG-1 IB]
MTRDLPTRLPSDSSRDVPALVTRSSIILLGIIGRPLAQALDGDATKVSGRLLSQESSRLAFYHLLNAFHLPRCPLLSNVPQRILTTGRERGLDLTVEAAPTGRPNKPRAKEEWSIVLRSDWPPAATTRLLPPLISLPSQASHHALILDVSDASSRLSKRPEDPENVAQRFLNTKGT